MVRPRFLVGFPEAMVREGPEELTLRAEEEGASRTFFKTTKAGDLRWRPPLVEEDRHAICQAIFQAVERPEWEAMHKQYVETHRVVTVTRPQDNKKARAFWMMK